jgi:hypothetical protein
MNSETALSNRHVLFLSEKDPFHVLLAFGVTASDVFQMATSATALLVVDVQESFPQRPYWCDCDVPSFVERLQSLIDELGRAKSRSSRFFTSRIPSHFLWNLATLCRYGICLSRLMPFSKSAATAP